jgi:DNA-directed RNA polymerase specialized sigma24 family protein
MQRQIAERIAVQTGDERFMDQARGKVSSVLRSFQPPGSCRAIAEDAVGEVRLKLLERLPKLSGSQLELFATPEDDEGNSYLRQYLLKGVHNYALDRYRRWRGSISTTRNPGAETGGDDSAAMRTEKAQRRGVRARVETDDLIATLDKHISADECPGAAIDLDRVDQLLQAKGLSKKEIHVLKARLSGMTNTALAELHGGTEGKYRKIIERALDRSGLELDL